MSWIPPLCCHYPKAPALPTPTPTDSPWKKRVEIICKGRNGAPPPAPGPTDLTEWLWVRARPFTHVTLDLGLESSPVSWEWSINSTKLPSHTHHISSVGMGSIIYNTKTLHRGFQIHTNVQMNPWRQELPRTMRWNWKWSGRGPCWMRKMPAPWFYGDWMLFPWIKLQNVLMPHSRILDKW